MADKEIIVEIDEDGNVTIITQGFKGKACISESQWAKDLLGEEISRQLTPTYYENEGVSCKRHLPICG